MKLRFIVLALFLSCFSSLTSFAAETLSVAPEEGHNIFYDSIDEAKKSIDMMMFRLTDLKASKKLIEAKARGVQVRLILDNKGVVSPTATSVYQQIQAAGIDVILSSQVFSISHAKAAVFDGKWALITTMNLTRTIPYTRDFGIRTDDTGIVSEFQTVFAADWDNSKNQTGVTPKLVSDILIWSPVNAEGKILDFINKAQKTLLVEVENLGDRDIFAALKVAAARGVKVTVLVPACVSGMGTRNIFYMRDLAAAGIDARLSMPPYSGQNPYIHSKVIIQDGSSYYVGSQNLSYNSLSLAREVGMIMKDPQMSAQIEKVLNADVALSKPVQEVPVTFVCEEK